MGPNPQPSRAWGCFVSDYEVMRRLLTARPIAFHPELAIVLGGIHEALMFQQLAYWSDKGADPDGWIYKTNEEFRQETTINRYQLDKARASLVGRSVLEARRRGLPARMYYRIHWDALYRLLSEPVCAPSPNSEEPPPTVTTPVCAPSANLIADPEHALQGTKSTSETTQRGPFAIPELGISSDMFWHALLVAVEEQAAFPRAEVDTWLRPAHLAGRDGDALVIAAPTKVARDRLDARMLPQLRAVAAARFGAPVTFRVIVR